MLPRDELYDRDSVSRGVKAERHGSFSEDSSSVLHAQQRLLEQAGLAVALVDSSNRILAGSSALRDMLGDSATVLGSSLDSFVIPEDLQQFQKAFEAMTHGGYANGQTLGEWRWNSPKKKKYSLWLRLRVASRVEGHSLLLFDDISNVKDLEKQVVELDKKVTQLEETFENFPLGIARFSENEELTVNRALEEIVGYKREEISTLDKWIELCFSERAEEVKQEYNGIKKMGFQRSARWLVKNKNGDLRFVEFFGAKCADGLVWVCQDITGKMLGEEQFRVIFDVCLEPMFITENETIVDCNDAFVKIVGASTKAELLAMAPSPETFCFEFAEDGITTSKERLAAFLRDSKFGQELQFEWLHKKLDGTPLPTHVLAKNIAAGERPVWIAVWRDLTNVKKTEEELRLAKERAEQGSQAKSSFLANMSHEIRTPMNGVIGVVELLLSTPLSLEQRSYLEIIQASGNNLLRIISDVLDLAKMESQSLTLEYLEFDLREHIDEALALFRVVAEEKGLVLSSCVDASVPKIIVGDSLRLRQVLLNLVSNSIKFTNRGSVEVHVTTKAADEDHENCSQLPVEKETSHNFDISTNLLVSVTDTGVGMHRDALRRLFDAFTQADTSTSRKYGGTGLGLTISKSLIKLMGGDIHVTSDPGKGSVFTFNIRVGVGHKSEGLLKIPSEIAACESPERLKILVAEDNKVNQIVITRMLKNLGVQWELVENGAQAVKACQEGNFNIILMDCHMPEMDGFDAARQIRRFESPRSDWSQPLIVALTAGALSHDKQRCEEAGMDVFLTKPVRHNDLRDVFVRELEGASANRKMPSFQK